MLAPEVERLFHELADLPPALWKQRLESEPISAEARRELLLLLAQDCGGETSPALQAVVSRQAGRVLAGYSHLGEMAGAYRLVKEIGRGGMGVVYLGGRDDGAVSQTAAVKILGSQAAAVPGLASRFLGERRIHSALSHPRIARLLDAGVTSGGSLYFAMEYCDGEAIDEFCRRRQLDDRSIASLVVQVCEAVSYAHVKMVVHRDLKPSNILVDAQGAPKLLDFGIAKVLQPGPAVADATRTVAPMLTLHYASPEQVRGEPASAACDVYSLGAVLYRLITGHYPHETATDAELPAAITTAEPRRPRHWQPRIAADLENILLTALHREPARRYLTVEALAADLRRFLDRRPVLATPPSVLYRAQRFVQRNPAATVASLFAVASLLGGAALSAYQARRAEQRLTDIRQLANVFLFDFEKNVRNVPGTLQARHRVIETARTYLEKVDSYSGGDPALQREVADSYRALADVQWAADFSRRGAQATVVSLEQSRAIRRRLADQDSPDPRRLLPYVETTALVCYRSSLVGNLERAREACEEAKRLAGRWSGRDPAGIEALRAVQTSSLAWAALLEAQGLPGEARASAERAYHAAAELARREPRNATELYRLLTSGRVYADMLVKLGRPEESLAPAAAAAAAGETLLAMSPIDTVWSRNTAAALMTIGSAHRALSQRAAPGQSREAHLAEAARHLQQALGYNEAAMRRDPADNAAKDAFIVGAHRLAPLLDSQRRPAEALALAERAREAARQLLAAEPSSRRYLYVMASVQLQAGQFLAALGRLPESDAALSDAAARLRQVFAIEANDATARETMISVDLRMAENAGRAGRLAQAHERWRAAKAEADAMIAKDPAARKYISNYALLESLGRHWGLR